VIILTTSTCVDFNTPYSRAWNRLAPRTQAVTKHKASVAIAPMAPAMDAALAALLEDILKDPPAGPIRKSFEAAFIKTTGDLCRVQDYILDTLKYELNGTDTDLPPMRIVRIKCLRDFLANRNSENLPLDSSSFVTHDVTAFITARRHVSPFALTVPTSVVTAPQGNAVIKRDGYFPTAANDDKCEKECQAFIDALIEPPKITTHSNNDSIDSADKITTDPADSTKIVSNASTIVHTASAVDTALAIVTPRYASPIHIGRSTTTKEETELSTDSKKICILRSTSTKELDIICHYGDVIDNGRYGASALDDVNAENCSSDNIDLADISIPPKIVPPDPYDRDNPVSSHCNVDDANLCNDRVDSVDIIVHSKRVAAVFGISDNPLDKDVFFNTGSEQLTVTTNPELNVAAARSIGNRAKHDQNAVFDDDDPEFIVSAVCLLEHGVAPTQNATFEDDDPHIEDATDLASNSLISFVDDVERNSSAGIAALILSLSVDNANEIEIGVATTATAEAMKPILTNCNLASVPVAKKTIGISVDPPTSNVTSAPMFFYAENNNVAESNVAAAAAAAMEPFSAEAAKAADYKAATTTSKAPAAAATLTNFYAAETRETDSDFAAADAAAKMVIHKSTILRHSPEPENGLVFHNSTAAAVAAEDDVFALVDAFVPSDNAVGLAHVYRSNVDTSRYDKQIYCYAFVIPPIISMRFKAFPMPRNAFYYHYCCQLSEQYATEALPILMPRGAQHLVHYQLDSIEAREYFCFDNKQQQQQ